MTSRARTALAATWFALATRNHRLARYHTANTLEICAEMLEAAPLAHQLPSLWEAKARAIAHPAIRRTYRMLADILLAWVAGDYRGLA